MAPDFHALPFFRLAAPAATVHTPLCLGATDWASLPGHVLTAMRVLVAAVWRTHTIWLPLQLYLCIAVASHLAPSPRDLASATLALPILLAATVALAFLFALAGHATESASLIAPVAGLLLLLVALFQGLYVTAIALVTARR